MSSRQPGRQRKYALSAGRVDLGVDPEEGETREIASPAAGHVEKFKRAAAAPDVATRWRCRSGR